MKCEQLSVREALSAGGALPFALIRSLSQVTLGRTPARVEEEELLEARFFSETQEIRIFQGADGLRAVRLTGEASDRVLEQTCALENDRFGGTLTIARVLEWDEDGQAYVAATRLTGWKEAAYA